MTIVKESLARVREPSKASKPMALPRTSLSNRENLDLAGPCLMIFTEGQPESRVNTQKNGVVAIFITRR